MVTGSDRLVASVRGLHTNLLMDHHVGPMPRPRTENSAEGLHRL